MACDVFISFKSIAPGGGLTVDRIIAERLSMKLRDEGLEVFCSEKDHNPGAVNSEYMDRIYHALEEARVFIVVGSRAEYIHSRFIKSEWSVYLESMQSGHKQDGHIITVLHGITAGDLPAQLQPFGAFDSNDLDGAVDHILRTLGRGKRAEADGIAGEAGARQ